MHKIIIRKKLLIVFALIISFSVCLIGSVIFNNAIVTKADEGFNMLNPDIYINEKDYSKNGLIFTAEIGETYPQSAEYHMLILPFDFICSLDIDSDSGAEYLSAIKNNTSDYIDIKCTPYKNALINESKPDAYYVSGSIISIKYDNINADWFGISYYVIDGDTVFANVQAENQNVANLPYLASKAINQSRYNSAADANKSSIIKKYISDGYDKAKGNEKGSSDYNSLTNLFNVEPASIAPNSQIEWSSDIPEGLKLYIEYSAENENYATVSDVGLIKGIKGDGDKNTFKNVYAKVLGKTYAKPLHVYKIETDITVDREVICTADTVIDGERYYKTANFGGLKIDGETDVDGVASLQYFSTNPNVSVSEKGVAECNFTGDFNGKYFYVYYKCDVGGITFISSLKKIRVIAPKSSNVLKFAKSVRTLYRLDAEEIFGADTGEVVEEVYDSENLSDNLFSGGMINVSSVPMGDRVFKIKTASTTIEIKAIVTDVIINDAEDLKEFISLRSGANNDKTDYNYGWKDKNSNGIVDEGERIYFALGNNITYGRSVGKKYRNDGFAGLLDNKENVGFLGIFDGCGYTITAMDVRDGGLFGDLGYGSVVKNLGCKLTTKQSSSYKCVVFACIMWGAKIDNCYIEYKQTHATADYVGMSDASKETTMSNTVIYAYQKSNGNKTGVVVSYAAGGKTSVTTDNVIMIYRSDNHNFSVKSKSGGADCWDDSIQGLYKVDGTGTNADSFDYNQGAIDLTKTIDSNVYAFSNSNFNTKYFETDTLCGIPKWKNQ